jgi:hypothetical protein
MRNGVRLSSSCSVQLTKYNTEGRGTTNHSSFDQQYLPHSELRRNNTRISDFKAKHWPQNHRLNKKWENLINHAAMSLTFHYYPQSPCHMSRVWLLSTILRCLWRLWSTLTLLCLCSVTQPHGLGCLICMPRNFVSLNPEDCLECSPVTQNMAFRL